MDTKDVDLMAIDELRSELKNARKIIADLKRENEELRSALEKLSGSSTSSDLRKSAVDDDKGGEAITIVAVGDDERSAKVAEKLAAELRESIPAMKNVVLTCGEAEAHDVLWSLDAGVQYVVVLWPEDIETNTCGINAINKSSDGLLLFIGPVFVFSLLVFSFD